MQALRIPIAGCLKILAISGSLGGLYTLYQLLQIGQNTLTPTDIRLLLMVCIFGLTGSLLLIFGALIILLSERLLEVLTRFQNLRMKKAQGYKVTVDSERISHLELVVASALEGIQRRLQVLEEKINEEPFVPYG